MVNYANGKIYMISANDAVEGDGNIYIGSTTKEYLSQRMVCHRRDHVQWKNGNVKVGKINSFDIFDKFGVNHCRIILLETFPCQSKDELTSREAFYIRSTLNVNKMIPHRTRAEYKADNHEDILQKGIDYYKMNKDSINLKRRECETVVCECGNFVSRLALIKHRRTQKHISSLAQLDSVCPTDSV
jgi:ribosomal protein S27AE